jgi:hypothetical protein
VFKLYLDTICVEADIKVCKEKGQLIPLPSQKRVFISSVYVNITANANPTSWFQTPISLVSNSSRLTTTKFHEAKLKDSNQMLTNFSIGFPLQRHKSGNKMKSSCNPFKQLNSALPESN